MKDSEAIKIIREIIIRHFGDGDKLYIYEKIFLKEILDVFDRKCSKNKQKAE